MKKVPFEYVDCSRCAVLERQLAEAQRKLDETPHDYKCACYDDFDCDCYKRDHAAAIEEGKR